jgi:hypothetical protein
LLLSHLGLARLERLQQSPDAVTSTPSVISLDPDSTPALQQHLDQLDNIPCRTPDTVHVFYVKAGQKMPFEILNNVVGGFMYKLCVRAYNVVR